MLVHQQNGNPVQRQFPKCADTIDACTDYQHIKLRGFYAVDIRCSFAVVRHIGDILVIIVAGLTLVYGDGSQRASLYAGLGA